jgi:hypothetical protein
MLVIQYGKDRVPPNLCWKISHGLPRPQRERLRISGQGPVVVTQRRQPAGLLHQPPPTQQIDLTVVGDQLIPARRSADDPGRRPD